MSNKKVDATLKEILSEADKITLDNNEFDKILNEQNAILCDINHMLDKNTPEDKKICNPVITKSDYKLNKMIDEFYQMHNLKRPNNNKTLSKIAKPHKKRSKTKKDCNKKENKHSDKHIDILINKPIVFMKDIAPRYKIKIKTKKHM